MMQGLGFCVWLLASKSHPWHQIVRDLQEKLGLGEKCRPHVRVASRLSSPMTPDMPSLEQFAKATVVGGLYSVTERVHGWPPLHTIELPVRIEPGNFSNNLHVSLAHRFGVSPFSSEELQIAQSVLDDYENWKECSNMIPIIANVRLPNPNRWRDISG